MRAKLRSGEFVSAAGVAALAAAIFAAAPAARGQQHTSKIPLADKVIPAGPTHQAFSGVVDSVDNKLHVLNVNSVKDANYEIFPLGKKTKVATVDGRALTTAALVKGTEVIVYYEQKGGHRSVQNIVVLPARHKDPKTSPPS